MIISFVKASLKYKKVILNWFTKPHVNEFFYGDGLKNTLNNIDLYMNGQNNNGKYSFDLWVALIDNKPFGFLMTSPIEGPNDNLKKWYVDGKTTFTLDLLIGEEEYLGKGLASLMIRNFIVDMFNHADYFLIDPAARNPKAIHVYEKAGFKKVGDFVPDYDPNPHVMMRLAVSYLRSIKRHD